ncbi:6279_t:CDS:10 [Ambispora gerdemannii]|uniref:1-phosphatidylinositol 4-kinase n=1 Tax=Ambispora gerdemannii TaxID=144530 RepID=A0A9N8Z1G9_9GLOM|nr:6279_t:CDS:10 [Ambispora gerdemannii]
MSEIEFFLPQLCHLLISRTTESVALECFILESCEKSTHMAILTLWYLQAYRSDLSSNPNSPAFAVCKRVLNKCQAIVFAENQNAEDKGVTNRDCSPRKVRENTFPAFVGIGAMLAGIATPMLMKSPGHIAIAQGRRLRSFVNGPTGGHVRRKTATGTMQITKTQSEFSAEEILKGALHKDDSLPHDPLIETKNETLVEEENKEILSKDSNTHDEIKSHTEKESVVHDQVIIHPVRKDSDLSKDTRVPRGKKEALEKDHTLNIYVESESQSKTSVEVFANNTSLITSNEHSLSTNVNKPHTRSLSRSSFSSSSPDLRIGVTEEVLKSPSLTDLHQGNIFSLHKPGVSITKTRPQSASFPSDNTLTDEHDIDFSHLRASREVSNKNLLDEAEESGPERQRRLLKGNFFHSEMQFLLALQDISTRLIIVPRETRLSTLRAELTLLNHNLPAEICIPLWCPSTSENPFHHRVVRISPSDAVVLNSADRVPYLLMVEVLEEDASFDMSKLQIRRPLNRLLHEDKPVGETAESPIPEDEAKEKEAFEKIEQQEQEEHKFLHKPITEVEKETELLYDSDKQASSPPSSTLSSPSVAHLKLPSSRSSKRAESLDKASNLPSLSSIKHYDQNSTKTEMTALPSNENDNDESDKLSFPLFSSSTSSLSESNTEYLKEVMNRRLSNSADEFAERMRTAAVMLAQLNTAQQGRTSTVAGASNTTPKTKADTEAIRQKIIKEMMTLEEERMLKMTTEGVTSGVGGSGGEGGGGEMLEDEKLVLNAVNKDDPSAAVFREDWGTKKQRIRKASPYGHYPNWQLLSVIVKTGADLRQEQLACQLIKEMQRIWQDAGVDVWAKYYRVLVTSDNSGLIETITNSISIHSIKKDAYAKRLNEKGFMFTLFDYFVKTFGDVSSEAFLRAQDNFMRSLAAYSLVSYILQVKDRHNGNVLLDTDGHLIHIDFGFMLSNSPGSVGFELAPFKLSQEYLDILGGVTSEKFNEFKTLIKQAFTALRKHADNIVLLVEMMQKDSKLPCFAYGEITASQLKDRFQLSLTEPQFEEFVERLIMSSCCNVFTRLYDTFQYYSNGIL